MVAKSSPFHVVTELLFSTVKITDGFWKDRASINHDTGIFHQWKKLEETGSIDNFRIVALLKEGFRRGFFYSDSDVHKWADAASILLASQFDHKLNRLLNEYIAVVQQAQASDGYIYTYNQFHFPTRRWANIQIEHELYCLGHLIEAGLSHHLATGSEALLNIAIKSANLIVEVFRECSPSMTPGHPEIELALIKLYRATKNRDYLLMAQHFIEQRGKTRLFFTHLIKQNFDQNRRTKLIQHQKLAQNITDEKDFEMNFSEMAQKKEPFAIMLRALMSFLSGKYFPQHKPIRHWKSPVGHSVRFGYFVTAVTQLFHEIGDQSLLSTLETLWDEMVQKRMYISGGIGSLPIIEGFGRDYELNNSYAYCETCAAIASIFWSWEMALATNHPKYHDLIERQLYNAASVGISLDGKTYLYRNILASDGDFERQSWFETPCCPSNISRLWGLVGKYIYTHSEDSIWINQYISSETSFSLQNFSNSPDLHVNKEDIVKIHMESQFPWEGTCKIHFDPDVPRVFNLYLRIPSWVDDFDVHYNNSPVPFSILSEHFSTSEIFPDRMIQNSYFIKISREWKSGDYLSLHFPMTVHINRTHPKIRTNRNRVALSRGPVLFCLEDIDNPNTDLSTVEIDLNKPIVAEHLDTLLKGTSVLNAVSSSDSPLRFIPYFAWLNRNRSKMHVWVKSSNSKNI